MSNSSDDPQREVYGAPCPQCADGGQVQARDGIGDFRYRTCGTDFHRVRIVRGWGARPEFWDSIYSGQAKATPTDIERIAFSDASSTDWMPSERANEILAWAATVPGWPPSGPYPLLVGEGRGRGSGVRELCGQDGPNATAGFTMLPTSLGMTDPYRAPTDLHRFETFELTDPDYQ